MSDSLICPGIPSNPTTRRWPTETVGGCACTACEKDQPTPPVVVLLHGEPSWSYLYRTMIPVLVGAGLGVVAPDLVGFGRSDKPSERSDYTFARHVEWMRSSSSTSWICRDVTLVCQDWGGLIGLRLVGEHPERFARVVAANTFLPDGRHRPRRGVLCLAALLPRGRGVPDRVHRQLGLPE